MTVRRRAAAGCRGRASTGAALAMLFALAAGCASEQGGWSNPNVPEEQWAQDKAACQSFARNEAEREFDQRQASGPSLAYDPSGHWSQQMNRFSAQQRAQQLFANCMQVRGYTQAPEPVADKAAQPAAEAGAPDQAPR